MRWCATLLALALASRRGDDDELGRLEPEVESKSFSFLLPEPQDLSEVEHFGASLGPLEEVQRALAQDPGSAAALLQRLSGQRRGASDGHDRNAQAYYHLLELHFQNRHATKGASLPRGLMWQLAEDVRRLNQLKRMSLAQLQALPADEVDNFVHYFKGLKRPGQSVAEGAQAARTAVIFTCSYGEGHRSAQQAMEEMLKEANYEVHSVDTTRDPAFEELGTDFVDMWYNKLMLRWKMYNLQNMFETARSLIFGPHHLPCPSPSCNNPYKDAFRGVMLELQPDIVVTVYHMDLLPILEVAKDVGNVPVLHVPTDMDLKMREVFGKLRAVYPRFKLAMPFPQLSSQKTALPLPQQRTFLAGYAVRQPFLEPQDTMRTEAERSRLVAPGTKVVLVMTGGGGQDVPWPEQLATEGIGTRIHVIVVAGRNEVIKTRLEHALTAGESQGRRVLQGSDPQVTLEVAQGPNGSYVAAERLAELMDLSHAIITKPGGGTTAELAYRGLPAVFDATEGLLRWEDFTVQSFEDQGRGERFETAQELPQVLRTALEKNRSWRLVQDPSSGEVLNPKRRMLAEIEKLMATACRNCSLLANPECSGCKGRRGDELNFEVK